jgi:hypothetical protein
MRFLLTKIAVKFLFLVLFSSVLAGTVLHTRASACETCVQLETGGQIWYGCAQEYGNLGMEECVPEDTHCYTAGRQCDPTPGNCQEYPYQPGCGE